MIVTTTILAIIVMAIVAIRMCSVKGHSQIRSQCFILGLRKSQVSYHEKHGNG